MKFSFDPAASDEFLRAARYYAQANRRLGRRFIEELYRCVSLLLDNPYLGHRVSGDDRRFLLQ